MLRWLLPSAVPAALLLALVWRIDKRREPPVLVLTIAALGVLAELGSRALERLAAGFTGVDVYGEGVRDASFFVFLVLFAAPLREAAKVVAVWPAYRSQWFDEPFDGIVYASAGSLGFAAAESATILRLHPTGGIWIARALVALPAHVFFAGVWGYALGRARREKRARLFPLAWGVATAAHALYIHLVWGRGPGALVGTVPLLGAMALLVLLAGRDLWRRGDEAAAVQEGRSGANLLGEGSSVVDRLSLASLATVSEVLRRERGQPIHLRWILFGALVTLGAMIVGLAGAIALGHAAGVDFSIVDERDVSTTAPVALLGAGVLAAYPTAGYLVAKASRLPTLLEPALAVLAALFATLVMLGLAAPVALIFGFAVSPVAWGLACAGAWIGRPSR